MFFPHLCFASLFHANSAAAICCIIFPVTALCTCRMVTAPCLAMNLHDENDARRVATSLLFAAKTSAPASIDLSSAMSPLHASTHLQSRHRPLLPFEISTHAVARPPRGPVAATSHMRKNMTALSRSVCRTRAIATLAPPPAFAAREHRACSSAPSCSLCDVSSSAIRACASSSLRCAPDNSLLHVARAAERACWPPSLARGGEKAPPARIDAPPPGKDSIFEALPCAQVMSGNCATLCLIGVCPRGAYPFSCHPRKIVSSQIGHVLR